MKYVVRLIVVLVVVGIASYMAVGRSIPASHPSLAGKEMPALIPVRDLVANTDYVDHYQVSPDGTRMVWNAVRWLRGAIIWQKADGTEDYKRFGKFAPRPHWAANSRTLLYQIDPSGWENTHVFALDTDTGEVRDLTPYEGVKASIGRIPATESDFIFVNHNRRDRAVFDVYRINVRTGEETLVHENTDNSLSMLLDDDGRPMVRVRQTDDARVLEAPDGDGWRELQRTDRFSFTWALDLNADASAVYALTDVGSDKRVLAEIALSDGKRKVLLDHPEVDIRTVRISQASRRPLTARFDPDYPEIHFFDPALEQLFAPLLKKRPAGLRIMSLSRDETVGTAVRYDDRGASFHRIRSNGSGKPALELLAETSPHAFAEHLVDKKAVSFKARDGLELNGYLTLPRVSNPKNLPTVLLVHGGPWARDRWGYGYVSQMLSNRGYAVLRINYRGSRGFGRTFMHAAEREFAGKMHDDLIDGLDWAIAEGITDPDRVAIMGGSYGGYATLVGMTMTPERFACGVNLVGISDLVTAMEDFPVYWEPFKHLWDRFVGDPANAEDRKDMAQRSPINHVDKVRGPILFVHGANDPRVRIDQSDRMVAKLREAGKPVDYIVFDDEGHGFNHWKNRLTYLRRTEDFLADCLGGRSSGFDYYQLGSWAF